MTYDQKLDLFARKLPKQIGQWAPQLIAAEIMTGTDALLTAAVLERETDGGESPYLSEKGPAGVGDHGHGHGLGQIDDRSHASFCAAFGPTGDRIVFDPNFNILFVAEHLARDLKRFAGSEPAALASYNADADRVENALRSVALPSTDSHVAALVDPLTTGGNYASWTLARRDLFRQLTGV